LTSVWLHPLSGEVLAVHRWSALDPGTRAYSFIYPLHIGTSAHSVARPCWSRLLLPAYFWRDMGRAGYGCGGAGDCRAGRPDRRDRPQWSASFA
jgi:hypothetical protein